MCHKVGKEMGTDKKVEKTALVNAVESASLGEVDLPELTDDDQLDAGGISGRKELCGSRTEAQAPHVMEEFINDVGAPYCQSSYYTKEETSRIGKDLMRKCSMKQTTTEPYDPW